MARPLEFWFDFASSYSYLSVMRIEESARQCGVDIRWRPFLLGPIFRELGWTTSPFVLHKAKGDYTWQDLARQCAKQQLRWQRPSVFPRNGLLALRVALVGADCGWIGAYCRRVMEINFAEDREIDSPGVVIEVLEGLGLPSRAIFEAAQSEAGKLRLRRQTEAAAHKGIFGAPMFFVGGEMFWGNDRLDDALACCVQPPP